MYAVIEFEHRAKEAYASFVVLGTYEHRKEAREAMAERYEKVVEESVECDCSFCTDSAYMRNESFDIWDWYVVSDDGRIYGYAFGGAYECCFDDEE